MKISELIELDVSPDKAVAAGTLLASAASVIPQIVDSSSFDELAAWNLIFQVLPETNPFELLEAFGLQINDDGYFETA